MKHKLDVGMTVSILRTWENYKRYGLSSSETRTWNQMMRLKTQGGCSKFHAMVRFPAEVGHLLLSYIDCSSEFSRLGD